MQLMDGTARRYGVTDRYDPTENLSAGTRYLRDLLDMFNDTTLAVAAYNAGENAVIRHGNQIPPYRETKGYVTRVLSLYDSFRGVQ
jgi:soluble lytic murein transglycosylase-like protein